MASRTRARKKSTKEQTLVSSTAPAQPMFQSCPFVVQSQAGTSQEQPDLKTALTRAERYGHHLSRMHPTGVSAVTAVQPKREMGASPELDTPNAPPVTQAKFKFPNFKFWGRKKQQAAALTTALPKTRDEPKELVDSFNEGDKLYGLAAERPQSAVKSKAGDRATVQDQLNNLFLATEGIGQRSKLLGGLAKAPNSEEANRFKTEVNSWKERATYKPSNEARPIIEEVSDYQEWLEKHPRYSPTNTKVREESLSSPFRQWDRVKKSCKAGIQYAVERGKKVHFILDGIDLETVINKQSYKTREPEVKVDPVTGDSQQNITASELRFVYRNWDDPLFKKGVEFWKEGKKVQAPWVDNPLLWQRSKRKPLKRPKPVVGSDGLLGELKQENPRLLS